MRFLLENIDKNLKFIINPEANSVVVNEVLKAMSDYKRSISLKRDNCGFINNELYLTLINNGINKDDLHFVHGLFKTDNLNLIDKNDLTQSEIKDFKRYYPNLKHDYIVDYIIKNKNKLAGGLNSFYNLPHYWLTYKGLIIDGAWEMFKPALDKPISENNYMQETLIENYLDKEQKFYDYGTKQIYKWITPELPYSSEIFDTSTLGGFSNYNKYLNDKSNIQMITAKQYFELVADGFNTSVDTQINGVQKNKQLLRHLRDVIFKYHKSFPMPFINKNNASEQEGRHRVFIFSELYGWDKSFPCLIFEKD